MRALSLALAAALLPGASLPHPAVPTVDARNEVVFDFRPRIVAPDDAGQRARRRDALSLQRDMHLHVFQQRSPDATNGDKSGCGRDRRTPLDGGHVGVVLSGGISKGLAFIGALEVIDRVGIRVDKIAGTSMGAVIGAFYAAGYSPNQLYGRIGETRIDGNGNGSSRDILSGINWRTLFTDIPDVRSLTLNQQASWGLGEGANALPRVYQGGLRSGQNLSSFLGKYLLPATAASNGCFDDLYVPFRAKATNVSTATSKPMVDGDLAVAVRASLSYPLLLTPTFIDGQRYIDGGMLDNYPVGAILERPEGATEAAPADTPFRVILGFDVSDTKSTTLARANLLQATSVLGAVGAVSDGIGAAISRETQRSLLAHPRCDTSKPPVDEPGRPCLLHFKFTRDGGFTDFSRPQIADFVNSGRALVLMELCKAFGTTSDAERCDKSFGDIASGKLNWSDLAIDQRAQLNNEAELAIRLIHDKIRAGPWSLLLHDLGQTMERTRQSLLDRPDVPERLGRLLQELGDEGEEPTAIDETVPPWADVLQGLEVRLDHRGRLYVRKSDALRADAGLRMQLLVDAQRTLGWLVRQLLQPPCDAKGCAPASPEDVPDFSTWAGVRISVDNRAVSVRVSAWRYQARGVVTASGLTERKTLFDASVDYWGLDEDARQDHLCTLRHRFGPERPARDCEKVLPDDPVIALRAQSRDDAVTYGLESDPKRTPQAPRPNAWKRRVHEVITGRAFDVRYFPVDSTACADKDGESCKATPSLPYTLEGLLERYYANAAVEYIRVDDIRQGWLEVAEKDTNRSRWGSMFFSYLYDYRNKHTFGGRYVYETRNDAWYKPTRMIASAAANEPVSDAHGMLLLDAKVLFLPSIGSRAPDLNVNPYLARRNQRIGASIPEFRYRESGVAATVAMRLGATGPHDFMVAPYLSASQRDIDDVAASDLAAVRERLRDPTIGAAHQRFRSLAFGMRLSHFVDEASFTEQFELTGHRAGGSAFSEAVGDLKLEAPLPASWGDRIASLRYFAASIGPWRDPGHDRRDANHPPPMDQLYSAGGFYPLAERGVWGRKRIDYLGADINEIWGTRVDLLEARVSAWRVSSLSYFAPYARLQLDVVLQHLRIGFAGDGARPWRTATGLVFSAYAPSLGSVKPRLSMAIGGDSRRDARFFSSLDLLF